MKVFIWIVFAIGLMTRCVPGQSPDQESQVAAITIVSCDTFGHPLPGARISLTRLGSRERLTAFGGEAKFDRVPFGAYEVEMKLSGFVNRREQIKVNQSLIVYRMGLELAPPHSFESTELSGAISEQMRVHPQLWVRLSAIYSSEVAENAVDRSGTFSLKGMAPGNYLLTLFENDKVLLVKPIKILGGRQRIELSAQ